MLESQENCSLSPRHNTYLLGHSQAEQDFLNAWKNNSLHNSWLISGIEGIGKATLAYKMARFILSADYQQKDSYTNLDVSPDSSIFKLVANNSHADLKIIERDYTDTDRRKIIKAIKDGAQLNAEEMSGLKKSAVIRIDDVRTINDFLSRRASNDGWRVVIIDSIDEMNNASANAVLKILEEPPYKTLLLLVSHNPQQLLPTIKSRCTKLYLKPLQDGEVASLLRRYRPDMSSADVKKTVAIASGSIGKALNYVDNDALQCYDELCKLIAKGNNFAIAELMDFCNKASADEENYRLTQELILKFLSDNVKQNSNVLALADCWDYALKIFAETSGLNLDKKQALINVIVNICKTKDTQC